MPSLVDAVLPYTPFPNPISLPNTIPTDGEQFQVCMNLEWWGFVGGCCLALLADSTWDSDDPVSVAIAENRAYNVIRSMIAPEACSMPVQFRVNPLDSHYWDFSTDGGTSWTRQPDTVTPLVPSFRTSGAGSGYDESVNGGLSWGGVPAMTAVTANDAVITDPNSLLRNLIVLAAGGPEALIAEVGSQIVFNLITAGITAIFNKNTASVVSQTDPVVEINSMGSGAPMLVVNP